VDGRWTGRCEGPAETLEVADESVRGETTRAECDAHRGCHADRRRAADDHLLDRLHDLLGFAVDGIDFPIRQQTLIEHHHPTRLPLDGSYPHGRELYRHACRRTRRKLPARAVRDQRFAAKLSTTSRVE